jgi:hypothetical protein
MNDTRDVHILLRMRYWRLADEPEVFDDFKEAEKAFEDYTRTSWEDNQSLAEEAGGDPDEMLGGPFAGTRILTVTIATSPQRHHAA